MITGKLVEPGDVVGTTSPYLFILTGIAWLLFPDPLFCTRGVPVRWPTLKSSPAQHCSEHATLREKTGNRSICNAIIMNFTRFFPVQLTINKHRFRNRQHLTYAVLGQTIRCHQENVYAMHQTTLPVWIFLSEPDYPAI